MLIDGDAAAMFPRSPLSTPFAMRFDSRGFAMQLRTWPAVASLLVGVLLARAAAGEEPAPFDPAAIPSDASIVIVARPAELTANGALRPLAAVLDTQLADQKLGISVAQLELFQLVVLGSPDESSGEFANFIVLRALKRHDWKPAMKAMFGESKSHQLAGRDVFQTNYGWDANPGDDTNAVYYWLPDERTVVFGPRIGFERTLEHVAANDLGPWHELWTSASKSPLACLLQTNLMPFTGLANIPEDLDPDAESVSDPLVQDGRFIVLQGDVSADGLKLAADVLCHSEEGAQRVAPALARSMTELANHLASTMETSDPPEARRLPEELARLAAATHFKVEGALVKIESLASGDFFRAFSASLVANARVETLQKADQKRIGELAAALNKYHEVHGQYPQPVMVSSDGATPYSWRVAILPYLEGGKALAARYRTNEAWDSEHNWQVMRDGIDLFRTPSPLETDDPTACGYYLITGPGTIFDGQSKPTRDSITDGLKLTALVVEARRNIPWTKPEDLAYSAETPVPELGGHFDKGYAIAMASGVARWILEMDEDSLRAMITKDRNDTLVIELQPLEVPAGQQ